MGLTHDNVRGRIYSILEQVEGLSRVEKVEIRLGADSWSYFVEAKGEKGNSVPKKGRFPQASPFSS